MTPFASRRDVALVAVTASVALVAGWWMGLWMVPDAALDVPTETSVGYEGTTVIDARYQPVPTWLPVISLFPLGVAVWAYNFAHAEPDDASDRGESDNYLDAIGGEEQ